jgi:hypothetical protein
MTDPAKEIDPATSRRYAEECRRLATTVPDRDTRPIAAVGSLRLGARGLHDLAPLFASARGAG